MQWRMGWIGLIAWAQAGAAPLELTTPLSIDGQPLQFKISAQLKAAPDGAGRLQADVDLGPLVGALQAALQRRLPRERCAHRGADNWVARLRQFSARVDQGELLLSVDLDVEAWGCLTWRRQQLRERLSHGRVYLELPLRVDVDTHGLRLRAGRPWVRTSGPLGNAARWYFALRGEEIGSLLAQRVDTLNASQRGYPLPALGPFQVQLEQAQFVDAGRPTLMLTAAVQPVLPAWMQWLGGRDAPTSAPRR